MSNDRELLELAAKAAGIRIHSWNFAGYAIIAGADGRPTGWNALKDDGDALRLAVNLAFHVKVCRRSIMVEMRELHDDIIEPYGADVFAATRRAIVRAAAEIGKAMP